MTDRIDKTRYPFGDMYVGDRWYITDIRQLEKVYPGALPLVVVLAASERLNALYHTGRVTELAVTLGNAPRLRELIRGAAKTAYDLKHIDSGEYGEVLETLEWN